MRGEVVPVVTARGVVTPFEWLEATELQLEAAEKLADERDLLCIGFASAREIWRVMAAARLAEVMGAEAACHTG